MTDRPVLRFPHLEDEKEREGSFSSDEHEALRSDYVREARYSGLNPVDEDRLIETQVEEVLRANARWRQPLLVR